MSEQLGPRPFTAAQIEAVQRLQEKAWSEGHEVGFWNGRESHGDIEGILIGAPHAKANNPYLEPK